MFSDISSLNKEDKIKILEDSNLLDELFKEENYSKFNLFLSSLAKDEIPYLLNDIFLNKFTHDKDIINKMHMLISLYNVNTANFFNNPKVIKIIIDNFDKLSFYIKDFNDDFAIEFGKYILENNLDLYNFNYLSDSGELAVIKKYKDKLITQKIDIEFLLDLSKDSIQYLLNETYFQKLLCDTRVDYINNIIKKGVILPQVLQDNKIIVDKYVNIYDINKYHEYSENLQSNIFLYDHVVKSRHKIYDELIQDINLKLNIFNEYTYILKGKSNFKDELYNIRFKDAINKGKDPLLFLQELTITRMLEITIDKYFKDITYNFLKNVESMLSYINKIDTKLIPVERISLYNKLLNYYNLSLSERLKIYNQLSSRSMELFYDDFSTVKRYANRKIKESLFVPAPEKMKINEHGIKEYTLDGENFKLLVTATFFPRNSRKYPDKIWNKDYSSHVTSLSLIGNNNINTYRNPLQNVILGFSNYNIDNIMITYESDAYTDSMGSNRIQKFYEPDELINKTTSYNEIEISEKYQELKPSYVVCYDQVKPGDIEASKLLGNIPLIIIHTAMYSVKDDFYINKDVYKFPGEVSGTISYRSR